jgi:hypothetical protein
VVSCLRRHRQGGGRARCSGVYWVFIRFASIDLLLVLTNVKSGVILFKLGLAGVDPEWNLTLVPAKATKKAPAISHRD